MLNTVVSNVDVNAIKEGNIDFICLLANYKKASDNLRNELAEMESCRFIRSHHMGYGLFADEIFTLTSKDFK